MHVYKAHKKQAIFTTNRLAGTSKPNLLKITTKYAPKLNLMQLKPGLGPCTSSCQEIDRNFLPPRRACMGWAHRVMSVQNTLQTVQAPAFQWGSKDIVWPSIFPCIN